MTILVTGSAGFIGFHLTKKLLRSKIEVIGIDNLNNYYDKNLKISRLKILKEEASINKIKFDFFHEELENIKVIRDIFCINKPKNIINLAAQAGVRYSIEAPMAYVNSNIVGFMNILECCREFPPDHLLYASSSSVYGGNTNTPFKEKDSANHPMSLYAATKKSNELMAHSYSNLFNVPSTGMRFFTAYGPWGRPDMALFKFTKLILENKPIQIFNKGDIYRDFTYIEDVVECIFRLIPKAPFPNEKFNTDFPSPEISWSPHRIVNIGNSKKISVMEFINNLEKCLGLKAKKEFLPMQAGDVKYTFADTSFLEKLINYKPNTEISYGIGEFIKWYKTYYLVPEK